MSPTASRMRIRSENSENTAQNSCTKSRASSTPLCKIVTHGNQFSIKTDDTIRLYFENANILPATKTGCHSDKVSKLRHVWSKIEVDFISLVETQINPSLLFCKDSLHTEMFRNQPATSILSNNTNELISIRQQVGVMLAVKGEVTKYATLIGDDPTGLGRWNYIDVVNRKKKVRIIYAYQCVQSKRSLGNVYLQRRRYFLARNINICPCKLFIMHLEQFITESIALGLEVILTVDVNEHVVKGKLSRHLRHLGLVEAYCNKFESTGGPASYFRGRHQIDGVWYIRNIVPTSVTICPFHFGVGDPQSLCSRLSNEQHYR